MTASLSVGWELVDMLDFQHWLRARRSERLAANEANRPQAWRGTDFHYERELPAFSYVLPVIPVCRMHRMWNVGLVFMADRDQAKRRRIAADSLGDPADRKRGDVGTVNGGTDARHSDPRIRAIEEADREDLADLSERLRKHFDRMLDEPVPERLAGVLRKSPKCKPCDPNGDS